MNLTQSESEHW